MNSLNEMFEYGMKRTIPHLLPSDAPALNLGSGNSEIPQADNLDLPDWNAETDDIPYPDGSIATVHAYHFLEHLHGADALRIMREVQRVLWPGGVFNIVVPHRLSQMAYHDLDHKSFWCEETFRNLLANPFYDKGREGWRLEVHFSILIGVVERNLAVMAQLFKR